MDFSDFTENQAKYTLAALAIQRLYDTPEGLTLKNLFSGTEDIVDVPVFKRVGLKKHWQRNFVERLIEKGWVVRKVTGSLQLFQAVQPKELEKIISDGDEAAIKKMLWPKDFEEAEDDSDEEEVEEELDPPVDARDQLIKELISKITSMTEVIGRLADGVNHIQGMMVKLNDNLIITDKNVKSVNEQSVRQLSDVSAQLTSVSTQLVKVEQKLSHSDRAVLIELVTKVADSGAKRKGLMNQLEAQDRRDGDLLREINERLKNLSEQGKADE